MNNVKLGVERTIYSADHTTRPTYVGERRMHPIEADGLRIGYVFSEYSGLMQAMIDAFKEKSDVTQSQGTADGPSETAARAQAARNDEAGREPGHDRHAEAGASGVRGARGATAVAADGGQTCEGGAGSRSGQNAIQTAAPGERQPERADSRPVRSLKPVGRVGARCTSCQWSAAVPVVGEDNWQEATTHLADKRHALESVCDEPDIVLDL